MFRRSKLHNRHSFTRVASLLLYFHADACGHGLAHVSDCESGQFGENHLLDAIGLWAEGTKAASVLGMLDWPPWFWSSPKFHESDNYLSGVSVEHWGVSSPDCLVCP